MDPEIMKVRDQQWAALIQDRLQSVADLMSCHPVALIDCL